MIQNREQRPSDHAHPPPLEIEKNVRQGWAILFIFPFTVAVIFATQIVGGCKGPAKPLDKIVTLTDTQGDVVQLSLWSSKPWTRPGSREEEDYYVSDGTQRAMLIQGDLTNRAMCVRVSPDGQQAVWEFGGHGVPEGGLLYDLKTRQFSKIQFRPVDPTNPWDRRGWYPGDPEARSLTPAAATTGAAAP